MQVVLCKMSDLPEGTKKRFELMGYDILAMHVGGTFYALDAYCTYKYADLGDAIVDAARGVLVCKDCNSSWELQTGQAKDPPATFPLQKYNVWEEGDELMLEFVY